MNSNSRLVANAVSGQENKKRLLVVAHQNEITSGVAVGSHISAIRDLVPRVILSAPYYATDLTKTTPISTSTAAKTKFHHVHEQQQQQQQQQHIPDDESGPRRGKPLITSRTSAKQRENSDNDEDEDEEDPLLAVSLQGSSANSSSSPPLPLPLANAKTQKAKKVTIGNANACNTCSRTSSSTYGSLAVITDSHNSNNSTNNYVRSVHDVPLEKTREKLQRHLAESRSMTIPSYVSTSTSTTSAMPTLSRKAQSSTSRTVITTTPIHNNNNNNKSNNDESKGKGRGRGRLDVGTRLSSSFASYQYSSSSLPKTTVEGLEAAVRCEDAPHLNLNAIVSSSPSDNVSSGARGTTLPSSYTYAGSSSSFHSCPEGQLRPPQGSSSSSWQRAHAVKEDNLRLRSGQSMAGLALLTQLESEARSHQRAAALVLSGSNNNKYNNNNKAREEKDDDVTNRAVVARPSSSSSSPTATILLHHHAAVNARRLALMEAKLASNYEEFLVNTHKREVGKHSHGAKLHAERADGWQCPVILAVTAQLMLRAVRVSRAKDTLRRLFINRAVAYLRRKRLRRKRLELIQHHEERLTEKPPNDVLRRSIPALENLPEGLVTLISDRVLSKKCFLPSEFIAYAGEPGDTCFILGKGGVECTSLTAEFVANYKRLHGSGGGGSHVAGGAHARSDINTNSRINGGGYHHRSHREQLENDARRGELSPADDDSLSHYRGDGGGGMRSGVVGGNNDGASFPTSGGGGGSLGSAGLLSHYQTDLTEAIATFKVRSGSTTNNNSYISSTSNSSLGGVGTIRKQWSVLCPSLVLTPEVYEHTFRACASGPSVGADCWIIRHAQFSAACDAYFSENKKALLNLLSLTTASSASAAVSDSPLTSPKSTRGRGAADGTPSASGGKNYTSSSPRGGGGGWQTTAANKHGPTTTSRREDNTANGGALATTTNNTTISTDVQQQIKQLESIEAAHDWYLRFVDSRREMSMIRHHRLTPAAVRRFSPLFAHWSEEGIRGIIAKARPLVRRKDDVIVRSGRYGKTLLMIVAGKLEVRTHYSSTNNSHSHHAQQQQQMSGPQEQQLGMGLPNDEGSTSIVSGGRGGGGGLGATVTTSTPSGGTTNTTAAAGTGAPPRRIEQFGPGSCIGDIASAAGIRSPNTTVVALTNSDVWEVDHKDIEALVIREDQNIFMATVLSAIDEHGNERPFYRGGGGGALSPPLLNVNAH